MSKQIYMFVCLNIERGRATCRPRFIPLCMLTSKYAMRNAKVTLSNTLLYY